MPKNKKTCRASNGMGSIRQRSDGRWEARYSAPDGKQRSVYGKTQKEVTAKLRGVLHDIDSGAWQEPSTMTLGEWLDVWLTDYQTNTSPRTIYKYRRITEKRYKPMIGDLRLSKLTPYHIHRLVTSYQEDGLAATTIHLYVSILESALQRAVEHKVITENPVVGVRLKSEPVKPFCIIDRADIPRFLEAVAGKRYENELKVMFYTGLRVGEIRGLRWKDIDFDAGTISVQRQLNPTIKGVPRISPPKYRETRTFHVAKDALDALKDQKRKQAEQRLKAGKNYHDDEITSDLVFRQPNGKYHGEHTVYWATKKLGEALDKPDLHPHDLRHSYAIAALRSGADVKTVQHNLGHKTVAMTLDVYAAYTNDAGRQSAEKLTAYLQSAQIGSN